VAVRHPQKRPRATKRARATVETPSALGFSFPPEWSRQRATWISWPRPEGISFPGTYHRVVPTIVAIVREIAKRQIVHLNVPNENYERIVLAQLREHGCPARNVRFHHIPTNECWTRDHGPAFVTRTRRGRVEGAVVDWRYNAWGGKYPPWNLDDAVPTLVAKALQLRVFLPAVVMEGGAVDFNGAGTVLTTTSCLQNPNRNPGLSQKATERYLREYYGQRHVVWLGDGIAGDDTDGHVDDLARFIGPRTIVLSSEQDPSDENFKPLRENRRLLDSARDQDGRPFEIVEVPMPKPIFCAGQRLPATYVNFLFINGALLVPTFRDRRRDREALAILRRALPRREVVGIDCVELAWGLGTIHCLTQQQPAFALPT
jgi:agmatine deiminase